MGMTRVYSCSACGIDVTNADATRIHGESFCNDCRDRRAVCIKAEPATPVYATKEERHVWFRAMLAAQTLQVLDPLSEKVVGSWAIRCADAALMAFRQKF